MACSCIFFKIELLNRSNFVTRKYDQNQYKNLTDQDFRNFKKKIASDFEIVCRRKTCYKILPWIKKTNV